MKTKITLTLFALMLCGILCDEAVKNNSRKRRSEFFSILKSAPEVIRELSDLWHVLLRNPSLSIYEAVFRSKEHEILGRIAKVNKNVLKLEQQINGIYGSLVENVVTTLPKTVKTELKLDQMMQIMEEIDIAQNEFSDYITSAKLNKTFEDMQQGDKRIKNLELSTDFPPGEEDMENEVSNYKSNPATTIRKREAGEIEKTTLLTFATWATGPEQGSIKTLLGKLHRIISPTNQVDTGILSLLGNRNTPGRCFNINLKPGFIFPKGFSNKARFSR